MIMTYFFAAFFIAVLFTVGTKFLAQRWRIMDKPDGGRKKHGRSVPLLGGTAIFLAFWLTAGYVAFFTDLLGRNLKPEHLIGVFLGSAVLIIVGFLDDKRGLSARTRLLAASGAVALALLSGVGIDKITNPFGGIWYLDFWSLSLGAWGTILWLADALVFFWILGMTYTVKILDGLDGLATGIAAIGALVVYAVASGARWHQPDMALVALIFAGACLGFLLFNFHPARIFLGEGGGLFLGYMLGVLSVISGGKIATALLVMAVPILDLARVIMVRVARGQSVFAGDREHLHFWLLTRGLSERGAVLILYAVALAFGGSALFLQSAQKLFALMFLLIVMGALAVFISQKRS